MQIPICDQHDDFIAWHFDNKGLFSVRSAYRVHVQLISKEAKCSCGESSTANEWRDVWKGIWKLNCLAKVHHFLWRLCHNNHPLSMNIQRRGVDLDTRCEVCHGLLEDVGHLFLRCKQVKACWRATLLEQVRIQLLNCANPLELVEAILNLPEEWKLRTVCLLWSWWTKQNRARHA